ncbi:MAG: hypothetical protein V4582_24220 [Pseudomonadota bacterium]
MRARRAALALLLLAWLPARAGAGCAPLRMAYSNQEVVPYYMGSGALPAKPPGATVELLREIAASAGCVLEFNRLPPARVPVGVDSGAVDSAPLGVVPGDYPNIVYPLDKHGQPDRARAVQMHTVAYVRASDKLAPATDPVSYLKGRKIGTFHGASFGTILRQAGYDIDDGALDAQRNFDKLRLGRIDAVLLSLANPEDLDPYIAEHFGGAIMRLDKPMRTAHVWLTFNRKYYEANREHVETMWIWLAGEGRARLGILLRQYNHDLP